ncbi:glycosyltransferase family 2 protein, partial [Candidatus Gottesmanbacteria bacterium]|nr:glycosyltransferase family 2 protein [Candidatus Gottesmanbacteria bacterium]
MIPKVSIIIPARNEEKIIDKMCLILLTLYDKYITEIIVVDDNSTDKTAFIIDKLKITHPKIKLIKRKPPNGVGLAIRDGLKQVSNKSSHIFTIDADFIQNVIDLEEFFLKVNQYDGLIGSRYLSKNSLVNYPLLKKVFNRSFHLLVRLLLGIKHKDLTNNFKIYRKELYLSLPLAANDYSINAETGLYPILMGKNIGEISVVWFARSRNMGTSKFNLLKVAPGYI